MKKITLTNDSNSAFRLSLIAVALTTCLFACSSGHKDTQANNDTQKPKEVEQQQVKPRDLSNTGLQEVVLKDKKRLTSEAEAIAMSVSADRTRVASSKMAVGMVHKPSFDSYAPPVVNTEKYQHNEENGVKLVTNEPVSTFSIDVDTGSYTNVRRMINQGMLPPADAVRAEEFINYFNYQYDKQNQAENDGPFNIHTDIASSPWNEGRHIMRIGIQGIDPNLSNNQSEKKASNLVFLLDVSGSMNQPNKLPLLTRSLNLLTNQLGGEDSVSIVVYAGASGVVLEPTKGNNKAKIEQALKSLKAGGSTNGQAGIELAYNKAEQAFIKGGVNRVILATDGDFNVGVTSHDKLIELIKQKRKKGIVLTTLGFGQGNYNDHLMEQLADAGDGNYAYIDTIHEARKVLVDELRSTLVTIAKDVKIQVEFNPNWVSEYRLVGYENRALKKEDFNNDKVDAGEIGANHRVTALYEVILANSQDKYVDALRYQQSTSKPAQSSTLIGEDFAGEIALVKLRYKPIDREKSKLITRTVLAEQITQFEQQSEDFRFATAVVGFAHLLKQSHYWQDLNYQQIADMASKAKGKDEFGYRAEFINLVRTSSSLQASQPVSSSKDILKDSPIVRQTKVEERAPKVTLLRAN